MHFIFINIYWTIITEDHELMNSVCTAMKTQAAATYGLRRSPILAIFQKVPLSPVLFLSSSEGHSDRMYAHVHTSSSSTVSSDWKLKMADILSLVLVHCFREDGPGALLLLEGLGLEALLFKAWMAF